MTTQTQPAEKMLANLRPGDRIQFAMTEIGLPSSTLVNSTVVQVRRVYEGWHQVETSDYGVLKVQDPTYKYLIVQ